MNLSNFSLDYLEPIASALWGNEKGANDPLGQLLITMVKAQTLNKDTKQALYGAYIIGRLWFFVILQDKEYSVSRTYDATRVEDMFDIKIFLQRTKKYIHQYLDLEDIP